MDIKWMGALLVIVSCGGFGFAIAAAHRRQETLLRQLSGILRRMHWELEYRMTALPELCRSVADEAEGPLKKVFSDLHRELLWQQRSEVSGCMRAALHRNPDLPPKLRRSLHHLGMILGRYDLNGQLQGLTSISKEVENLLLETGKDRQQRLRSYQTLGLCAGFALVILLF